VWGVVRLVFVAEVVVASALLFFFFVCLRLFFFFVVDCARCVQHLSLTLLPTQRPSLFLLVAEWLGRVLFRRSPHHPDSLDSEEKQQLAQGGVNFPPLKSNNEDNSSSRNDVRARRHRQCSDENHWRDVVLRRYAAAHQNRSGAWRQAARLRRGQLLHRVRVTHYTGEGGGSGALSRHAAGDADHTSSQTDHDGDGSAAPYHCKRTAENRLFITSSSIWCAISPWRPKPASASANTPFCPRMINKNAMFRRSLWSFTRLPRPLTWPS
jgi:hypothetical protein